MSIVDRLREALKALKGERAGTRSPAGEDATRPGVTRPRPPSGPHTPPSRQIIQPTAPSVRPPARESVAEHSEESGLEYHSFEDATYPLRAEVSRSRPSVSADSDEPVPASAPDPVVDPAGAPSRVRRESVMEQMVTFAVDRFLKELSARHPVERRSSAVVRDEIKEFVQASIQQEEQLLIEDHGGLGPKARRDLLAFAYHLTHLLWNRNQLNQDDRNQLLLARTLIDQLYLVAPGVDPPLRQKLLTFCICQSVPESYEFKGHSELAIPEFKSILDFCGILHPYLRQRASVENVLPRLLEFEAGIMGNVCRRAFLDLVPPTVGAACSAIPADLFTYSALAPILKLAAASTPEHPVLEADVSMILQQCLPARTSPQEQELFETHMYLSSQFERWMRAFPQLYTTGSPGNITRVKSASQALSGFPGRQKLDQIKWGFAEVLGTLLLAYNESAVGRFQQLVVEALDRFCPYEDLYHPIRKLDMVVYVVNSMNSLVRSLITKDIPLREETRLNTFLDAVYRVGQAVQFGDEHTVTRQLEDLLPDFLFCALPATSRGTEAWSRVLDGLQRIGTEAIASTTPSRWDALADGVKFVRQLERKEVMSGSPAETMHYVFQKDGVLPDAAIQRVVESSGIIRVYDLFFRILFPRIKELLESVKSVGVKHVDMHPRSPFGGKEHAMKTVLDVQHRLYTVQMFLLSLGIILADRLIFGAESTLSSVSADFLPHIGDGETSQDLPRGVLQKETLTDKLIPCLTRLYPLTPQEIECVVREAVSAMDPDDRAGFRTEERRSRLVQWLVEALGKAIQQNERVFSPDYMEAVSFLKRIPARVNPDIHDFFRTVLFTKALHACIQVNVRDLLEQRLKETPAGSQPDVEERTLKALEFYRLRAELSVQECIVLYNSTVSVLRHASGAPSGLSPLQRAQLQPAFDASTASELLDRLGSPEPDENPFL